MAKKAAKKASKTARKAKPSSRKTVKKPAATGKKKPVAGKSVKKSVKKTGRKTGRKPSAAAPAASGKTVRKKRPKCPLTAAELRQVRALLLEKRRAILGDMSGMEAEALGHGHGGSGGLSNMPTHPADIGTDNYEQEFTLGLLESERTMLAEIDEALERISLGTYGICLGTDEPIGKARLLARPWAKYTIEYARLIERGLARPVEKSDRPRPDDTSDDENDNVAADEDDESLD